MFTVIEFGENQNRFKKGRISSERFSLPSGDAFFTVKAEKSFGKIPWKRLESCLGILRECVIVPDGAALPEEGNITAFSPDLLPRLMLLNSAADYITNRKKEFISSDLTLFDEKGIYIPYIEGLLKCFANIKIITPAKREYEKLSRHLMESYGLSLLIADSEPYPDGTVISHSCNVPVYFKGTVFTNEKKYLMSGKTICGNDTVLPEFYEKLRPAGVSRLLFASALYEKCGADELKELKYEGFGC